MVSPALFIQFNRSGHFYKINYRPFLNLMKSSMDHWMFNCHNRKKVEFQWNSKKHVNYATPLDPFKLKLNKATRDAQANIAEMLR